MKRHLGMKTYRARKAHICSKCGKKIRRGETYIRVTAQAESGDIRVVKLHRDDCPT